ncbi:MAG: TaqI-like C-terminal specificity domain-containing protein, partial [bacterium]
AFSVLPVEILGQVYEQFLGQVIHLTEGHHAKIEEKPEVKKAGGVYYTPAYIVDYIVKNTVGKLLEEKIPKQAAKLKILDPACGSGSFLIGAYQYLLDWHRDWYVQDGATKNSGGKKPVIFQYRSGEWRLTSTEKKRILLAHIFGVDIDTQAVEVTKLSLLLKVLENETEESVKKQLKFFRERALPDLGGNIKCGNSLIGPDFDMTGLSDEERRRINPFDWEREFPEIMRSGGFDAVIGNPPYGISFDEIELAHLMRKFGSARKYPDSYCLFMIQGMQLLRTIGTLSFIVPNTFCDLENCDDFRRALLQEWKLLRIWQSGWVFKNAIVDTLVFLAQNNKPNNDHAIEVQVGQHQYRRRVDELLKQDLFKIDYRNTEEDKKLLARIAFHSVPLANLSIVKAGVKMYEKGKGTPPQTDKTMKERPFSKRGECPQSWKPLYRGEAISRYNCKPTKEFVLYGPWLAAPRSAELFESPKILMRRTDDHLLSFIENESAICVNSCHIIKLDDEAKEKISYNYLLGLLNSSLLQKIFEIQNPQMVGKVFAEIKVIYVERLPIRTIDFSDPKDKARHDRMVKLVEEMLDLHKKLPAARTEHEKTLIQRQIEATDQKIDRLVYDLYDLTKDEIKLVEESGKEK